MAFDYIQEISHDTYAHNNIIIVSDLLSALVAISAPQYGKNIFVNIIKIRYALQRLLQARNSRAVLAWISAHKGICGNEMVDK